MATLSFPRIRKCSHPKCTSQGIAPDKKCLRHTSYRSKHPADLKDPFGLELEYIASNHYYSDLHGIAGKVTCDGSLPGRGVEINHVEEYPKVGYNVGKIAKSIKEYDPRARVNRDCGFHVHMNLHKTFTGSRAARYQATNEQIVRFNRGMKSLEPSVSRIFPTRFQNYHINRIDSLGYTCKYNWINLSSAYNTCEIRIHGGTLNAHKIYAWVKVCKKFQQLAIDLLEDNDTMLRAKAEKGDLIGMFRKNSVAHQYISRRFDNPSLSGFAIR